MVDVASINLALYQAEAIKRERKDKEKEIEELTKKVDALLEQRKILLEENKKAIFEILDHIEGPDKYILKELFEIKCILEEEVLKSDNPYTREGYSESESVVYKRMCDIIDRNIVNPLERR